MSIVIVPLAQSAPKVTFSANVVPVPLSTSEQFAEKLHSDCDWTHDPASPNNDDAIETADRSGVVPNTNVCGTRSQQLTPGPEAGGADWVTIVMVSV